ncbi:hypothetical protein DFH11DRAFT_1591365 [Phellopilus nigrolimitatus]|nr:hypothetical protein DFH11DRAFT_1591365 [Phellopilus nigrolimitatus]
MHFIRLLLSLAVLTFGSLPVLADRGSYFKFNQPVQGTEWVNGQANPILWKKGLLDGVDTVDLELARLSSDGLILAALNVPALPGQLNLFIENVPPGDDYYLIFIDSTLGAMYAVSPRFTILAAGSSVNSSASASAAVASATTVTVSGGPNPTAVFGTTFPALNNGALAWRINSNARHAFFGVGCAVATMILGAAWTIL